MTLLSALAALLLSSAPARACATVDLDAVVQDVRVLWQQQGATTALDALQAAWGGLPNACTSPTDLQLASAAQLGGSLAYYNEDETTARTWFLRAATVTPHVPFGEGLGPEAGALYAEVLSEVSDSPRAYILAGRPLVVDGRPLDRHEELTVAPGDHLVATTGEALRIQWLALLPLQRATLPESEAPLRAPLSSRRAGFILGGAGLASSAVGLGIYIPTLLGPWEDCRGIPATSSPKDCEDAVGANVVLRVAASRILLVGGAGLVVAGGALVVWPTVGPGEGLAITGRW